jgi:hypothetical protein
MKKRHTSEDGPTPINSIYNFLWVTGFDGEPSRGDIGGERLFSGDGELTGCGRFPLFGGLSTTPSSTAFVEKSIVERAVAAEYMMCPNPLWDMVNCP